MYHLDTICRQLTDQDERTCENRRQGTRYELRKTTIHNVHCKSVTLILKVHDALAVIKCQTLAQQCHFGYTVSQKTRQLCRAVVPTSMD